MTVYIVTFHHSYEGTHSKGVRVFDDKQHAIEHAAANKYADWAEVWECPVDSDDEPIVTEHGRIR